MSLSNITIGADPELFIIDSKTGKVVSSIGLIPGTKGNAYVDDTMPKGFGVEIDNILAEFNIPPVTTKEGFINNILYMQDWIRSFVKNVNPDYDIKCSASEMVDSDQLQSEEANLFGCDPDFNCYTKTRNPKPKPPKNLRSAGFHIHFGYANFDVETSLKIVRLFDLCVGVPSVRIDSDKKRRSLYGKAGAFRLQDWGVEYRCLSSYMMKDADTLSRVWAGITQVRDYMNNGIFPSVADTERVVDCINYGDESLAKYLVDKYKLIM